MSRYLAHVFFNMRTKKNFKKRLMVNDFKCPNGNFKIRFPLELWSSTHLRKCARCHVQVVDCHSRNEEHWRQGNKPSNKFSPWWILIVTIRDTTPLRYTEQEDSCHDERCTEPPAKPPPSSWTTTYHFLNVKRKPVSAINPGQGYSFKESQEQKRDTSWLVVK